MLLSLALVMGMSTLVGAQAPKILEVSRDYLKPQGVPENRKLERRAEKFCRTLNFTHNYLTIESVTGPPEMWYLNGFASEAELDKLRREFTANAPLLAALDAITLRKVPLKRTESTDEFAHNRPDLSRGEPWLIDRGRFLVIAWFRGDPPLDGTVFEFSDGRTMVVRATQTSAQARALAASAGLEVQIFRVLNYFRPNG